MALSWEAFSRLFEAPHSKQHLSGLLLLLKNRAHPTFSCSLANGEREVGSRGLGAGPFSLA